MKRQEYTATESNSDASLVFLFSPSEPGVLKYIYVSSGTIHCVRWCGRLWALFCTDEDEFGIRTLSLPLGFIYPGGQLEITVHCPSLPCTCAIEHEAPT